MKLPVVDQDQIAGSLKEQTYSGDIDGVTAQLEERTRRGWQEHGYFEVQVHGDGRVLTSSPVETRVAITLRVDEGQQYRLGGITFKNTRVIKDLQSLRDLFPIRDGDLFNATLFADGLKKLSDAYGQLGYINFTSVPETRISEEQQTVWVDLDLDDGKPFFVSGINVIGLDEQSSQRVLKDFLQKPGEVYSQQLVDLSMERLSAPSVAVESEERLDEKTGTVAITITFRECPVQ